MDDKIDTLKTTHFDLNLQRVYIKDVSFETPYSPQGFFDKWKPEMDLNLNTYVNQLNDGIYEVVLFVTVIVRNNTKTAFLAEVKQAGIFQVSNIREKEVDKVMNVTCPNILFPYAREVITDLVNRGGFPQLLLAPINFELLYLKQQTQLSQ